MEKEETDEYQKSQLEKLSGTWTDMSQVYLEIDSILSIYS